MRSALVVSLLLIPGFAGAQSDTDLQVPTAALTILELPIDRGLSLAMSRAVRILHSSPHEETPLPQMFGWTACWSISIDSKASSRERAHEASVWRWQRRIPSNRYSRTR